MGVPDELMRQRTPRPQIKAITFPSGDSPGLRENGSDVSCCFWLPSPAIMQMPPHSNAITSAARAHDGDWPVDRKRMSEPSTFDEKISDVNVGVPTPCTL